MDIEPGTRFGPYGIVERLGAGGMGVVYRARDTRLGRDVAIKVIGAESADDADRLRRFEQEARATSALNHPNILSVFDVGTRDGSPYIVSELLEGSTLRERLRSGPLGGKRGLDFAIQVSRGLAAAHQKGIVHRDLKPDNLFLTRDGQAKILDFGLAKLLEPIQPDQDSSDTLTGRILGTAGYMSPEQIRGEPADERSDIFSLGAVLYEMFSGQRAFQGPSQVETLNAILATDPSEVALSDAPPGVDTIIAHCVEKNPALRFQTAQDLAFNLEAIRDLSSAARPRLKTGLSSSRLRVWVPVIAVTLLVAAALIALGLKVTRLSPKTARSPTFTRLTFRQGNISDARFGPDGQTVVYGAAWDGKPMEIFTTRIDGPESRSLGLPTGSVFSVSPEGMLAITDGCDLNMGRCRGTLAQVAIAGGTPRQIAENVDSADWSPGGKDLAIVRAVGGRFRLEYPIGHVLVETTGWISDPRFSPNGRYIAFVDHPDFANVSGLLAVVDRSGKKTVLSEGWKSIFKLAWHTNDEIWFNASQTTRTVQLFAVKLDKSQRHVFSTAGDLELVDLAANGGALFLRTNIRTRLFVGDGGDERELSWFDWSTAADLSQDGKTLLFYEWGDGARGSPQVYIRPTNGSDATRLGNGRALSLSADGKWALALEESPSQHLVLLPTGAGDKHPLPPAGIIDFYSATFFPDGHHILIAGETKDHVPGSYVQDIEQGMLRSVGAKGMIASLVSADAKRIAAYGPDGRLYVMPSDGGELVPVNGTEIGDRLVQWSDDGHALYVRGPGDESVEIDRVDVTTGRRERWKRIVPSDRVGMIGVEQAVCVSRDGKSYAYTYWKVLQDLYFVGGMHE